MTAPADPRPLLGEPLPLDLLNTRWYADETELDLLALPDGLATWLASAGLPDSPTPETLEALLATRSALEDLTAEAGRDVGDARERLNTTLRHGHVRHLLGPDGPVEEVETDPPHWRVAWLAADGYLRLLADDPARVRVCAGPCRLRFFDVSKSGRRRWCSMAACGNRAKARTHYARTRGA